MSKYLLATLIQEAPTCRNLSFFYVNKNTRLYFKEQTCVLNHVRNLKDTKFGLPSNI